MWNMIIVDDERVICRGLRSTIPWKDLNIQVIGEAYNGLEALELIERNPVDILVTDIRMPEMDGLELTERVSECHPDIHVILMSGYDDFEYARQALRLGVRDYLLKPVDIDDLTFLIRRIGSELYGERRRRLESWLAAELLNTGSESAPSLNFLRQKPMGFYLVCSQLEDYALLEESLNESGIEEIRSQWRNSLASFLERQGLEAVSAFLHKNLLAALIFTDRGMQEPEIVSLLARFTTEWSGLASVGLAMSTFKESLEHCSEAYREARSVIDVPHLKYMPVVFYRGESKKFFDERIVYWEQRFIAWMFQNNKEELDSHVNGFFEDMANEKCSLSFVADSCKAILQGLFRRMQELDVTYKDELHFAEQPDLRVNNTYDRLREWLREDLNSIRSFIHSCGYFKNRDLIGKAEAYIKEHLSENLKAAEVAGRIHVSPGYFSQVFKQETGKSFNEYLNTLRVNQAKELLADTSQKIFEIAEIVGYKDYKHFVFIFKKITGMTPTQFRELLLSRA